VNFLVSEVPLYASAPLSRAGAKWSTGDGQSGQPQLAAPVKPVSAATLCTGGLDVIRKEAWPFYRTSSGVRLWWELKEPKGPKGPTGLGQTGQISEGDEIAPLICSGVHGGGYRGTSSITEGSDKNEGGLGVAVLNVKNVAPTVLKLHAPDERFPCTGVPLS